MRRGTPGVLVQGRLRPPLESREIGVLSVLRRFPLFLFAEGPLRFLFLALHLQRLFTFPLGESGFPWTSDDRLLGQSG